MRDDFAALDLLSADSDKKASNKMPGLPRRKLKKSARKEMLGNFQPLIAKIKKKQKADAVDVASLKGWPISLSWSAPRPVTREEFKDFL